ncbi:MAG TPA: hotdog fold thioesterase [Rhodothermales bacterium]|nr:hotdog fold thioesterase [Rhodothermales bacterium]
MQDADKHALLARADGLSKSLGIVYEKLDRSEVIAAMPITPQHLQPFGYLHGGASLVLAESVASVGAFLRCEPGKAAFGMEINANHLRPKRDGTLRAVARPVFTGRTSQVWEINIYDERERLICVSRCTLAIVDA